MFQSCSQSMTLTCTSLLKVYGLFHTISYNLSLSYTMRTKGVSSLWLPLYTSNKDRSSLNYLDNRLSSKPGISSVGEPCVITTIPVYHRFMLCGPKLLSYWHVHMWGVHMCLLRSYIPEIIHVYSLWWSYLFGFSFLFLVPKVAPNLWFFLLLLELAVFLYLVVLRLQHKRPHGVEDTYIVGVCVAFWALVVVEIYNHHTYGQSPCI